jgi:nucleotide-binding universal stress UspA family protein
VIVCGIDKSDTAKEALRFALHEATLRGTRLRVVHAWSMTPVVEMTGPGMIPVYDPTEVRTSAEKTLRSIVADVVGGRAAEVERVLVEGPAGDAILAQARDAELIVIGSRGFGSVKGFMLGSVSQHVLHGATCPVVVIPRRGA